MTQLPDLLVPVETLDLPLPSGATIKVSKTCPVFPMSGEPLKNTFGGKPRVEWCGNVCFAEVAIVRCFEAAGWSARWVETFGTADKSPKFLLGWTDQGIGAEVTVPIDDATVASRLAAIAARNGGSYAGCWDVVAWRGSRIVFAEAKWSRKDRIRKTQLRWLENAMQEGIPPEDFLVVEWTAR